MFARVIRTAIDEVVDGPRTGRWSLEQLANPEKTYVGTKVEIVAKALLGLPGSVEQDAEIAGYHVNIKWSKSLVWMIGPENVGAWCLGIGLSHEGSRFSVGLFQALESRLNRGGNRDGKRTLTRRAFENDVNWLIRDAELPPNFLETLEPITRDAIFAEKSAQARVRKLVSLVQAVPIPREAFYTVALNKDDPMRRLRRDKNRTDPLGGMVILSSRYGRQELERRGIPIPPKGHFIAVPDTIK